MIKQNDQVFEGQHIQSLSSMSPDKFKDLCLQRRPFKVKDAVREWKAVSLWSPKYLGDNFSQEEVNVGVSHNTIFSYDNRHNSNLKYRRMKMKEAVRIIKNNKREDRKYYLIDSIQLINNFKPKLMPSFQKINQYFNIPSWVDKNKSHMINLWFGEANNVTPLHFDLPHNLFAQVFGRKIFKLYSPEDSAFLYPAYVEEQRTHSKILDIDNPDYSRYPEFKKAKAFICLLEPGDVLFLPSGWWHQVYSLDIALSINFWWLSTLDETLFSHVSRCLMRGFYQQGRLAEMKKFFDLRDFKNNLEIAFYLNKMNCKWQAILFGIDFLESYLNKKIHGTSLYNQNDGQTFLEKNLELISSTFHTPKSDLNVLISYIKLASKEDDSLFSTSSERIPEKWTILPQALCA